jgi:hypothetical protein
VLSEVCGAPYIGWVGACGDEVAVAAKRESSRIFIHNGGYESGNCLTPVFKRDGKAARVAKTSLTHPSEESACMVTSVSSNMSDDIMVRSL